MGHTKKISVWVLVAALAAGLLSVVVPLSTPQAASAAVSSNFDPGNIISDEVFYDSSTMSTTDIQNFLNQRVPNCASGWTCLKNYSQSIQAKAARSYGCAAIAAADNLSAAQIISLVSTACSINPRVLLTLLEKEQSLVSSTAPSAGRFQSATGYGCPDTAACDADYYGFFNQVYNSARQFQYYRSTPGSWNYQAGRVNTIQWHPNAACGTSQVYITNQATAGLYIYTPYRPNDAALANLYGTGDACSSYGNRNFWRIFSDWFGSTTTSSAMVRGTGSMQIWLLSNGSKLPINNVDVYNSFAALGSVGSTSMQYLDSLPTGPEVTRFISDSVGNLYLVDSGIKYHFDSCARVAAWGYSCPNRTVLEDRIVAKLADPGGWLSNVVRDSSHQYWQIIGGTKRQAVDAETLAAVDGNPLTPVVDATIATLPVASPILRPDIVIKDVAAPNYWLYTLGATTAVPQDLYTGSVLGGSVPLRTLTAQSIAALNVTATMSGTVSGPDGSRFLLTQTGRLALATASVLPLAPLPVSAALLGAIPTVSGTFSESSTLRGIGTPEVYVVAGGVRHYLPSWTDYLRATGVTVPPTTYLVAPSVLAGIPQGPAYLRPGSIVRAQGTPAAYLVDGNSRLVPVSSYDDTAALGLGNTATEVAPALIASFPIASAPLSRTVLCASTSLVGMDGIARQVDAATKTAYGLGTPMPLDPTTCARLTVGSTPPTLIRAASTNAIYYIVGGQRRYVPTPELLTALGGTNPTILTLSDSALRAITVGLPLISADPSQQPTFIRGVSQAPVYLIRGGVRSYVVSPTALSFAFSQTGVSSILVVPGAVVDELPLGAVYVSPGMFVKADDSPSIYLVDGASKLIYLGSFGPYNALGGSVIAVVPRSALSGFTVGAGQVESAVSCDSTTYLGLGGLLYALTPEVVAQYGQPSAVTALQTATCAALPHAAGAPGPFITGPDGAVYLISAGVRHWVTTSASFLALGGNWQTLIHVSDFTVSQFSSGNNL